MIPTSPLGGFGAIIVGPEGTVITTVAVSVPSLFVALTTKVNVPVWLGFPVIVPFPFRVIPGGTVPLATVHVGTGFPVASSLRL